VSDPATSRPAICLNMIVRNEAHIVREVLDSVAPYISSWVIVDTGSDDGTQNVIRSHMAGLGIPGELYERPWRNFGHNRTEALTLARGRGDYIWAIDADDLVVGELDLGGLTADCYLLRFAKDDVQYWRRQLFRDGLRWRYEGVLHEYCECDDPFVAENLEGNYYIESRRLGARNLDPRKYARDAELLLAEVQRNPDDARSVFYLAQSYFDHGDFVSARKWYERRAAMGGFDEETYMAMFRVALSMAHLDEPLPDVVDAFLRAWEFRPSRAEPLYQTAFQYRTKERYQLGYLFAQRAAQIPFPEGDDLFVGADVYNWRAIDEQAVCASWIDKSPEAFTLCRHLLARRDIPDEDRKRIAANRDVAAPPVIDAASTYPDELAQRLVTGPRDSEVTVTLVAGQDRAATERMLNSFLQCCTDIARVGRFLVVPAGPSAEDRETLLERYPFLEFTDFALDQAPGAQLAQIRGQIGGRFWLHLGGGWRFFARERLVARLTAVLEAEPDVFQVGINFADATKLIDTTAPEDAVRRGADTGRYLLTDTAARGPAMFDTARLDRAGGFDTTAPDPIAELGQRASNAGLGTASLDEVLGIAGI
jgi:glycosyltransferase involved in cell wall biosynthesis